MRVDAEDDDDDDGWGVFDPRLPLSGPGWRAAPEFDLIWIEVDLPGCPEWISGWTFEVAGRPRAVEVRLRLREGSSGEVTSDLVRHLSPDRARDRLRQILPDPRVGALYGIDFVAEQVIPRPGRRGRSDSFFADLAAEYVSLLHLAAPTTVLAERRGYSVSRMGALLGEARVRDVLTEPPDGKAGGEMTPYGRSLLERPGE